MTRRLRLPAGCRWAAAAIGFALVPPGAAVSDDVSEKPESAVRAPERIAATAAVEGIIRLPDGKVAAGVRVLLLAVGGNDRRYEATTGPRGRFEIAGIEHGYFELVCVLEGETYLGNRTLPIPPEKTVEIEFMLDEFRAQDELIGLSPESTPSGIDGPAAGVARIVEDLGPTGWDWFRTGKGVAVLLAGGTVIVGGLIALADDDPSEPIVSDFLP